MGKGYQKTYFTKLLDQLTRVYYQTYPDRLKKRGFNFPSSLNHAIHKLLLYFVVLIRTHVRIASIDKAL